MSVVRRFVVLCLALTVIECRTIINEDLDNGWTLFQRVHQKIYSSMEEKTMRLGIDLSPIVSSFHKFSRQIWEENLSMIRKHNLEADMNIHSYYFGNESIW